MGATQASSSRKSEITMTWPRRVNVRSSSSSAPRTSTGADGVPSTRVASYNVDNTAMLAINASTREPVGGAIAPVAEIVTESRRSPAVRVVEEIVG